MRMSEYAIILLVAVVIALVLRTLFLTLMAPHTLFMVLGS
jgi:hypothetical protein